MPNKAGKKSKASKDALAKKRLFAELISTEETYVAGLETLTNVYKRPMLEQQKKLRVQTTDVTSIFSNVDAILQLHKILLGAFRDAPDAVVTTLGAHSAYFKMYTQYMSGYELALGTMDRLRKNKSFQAFLVSQQESGDGKGSSCLDIMSYLITPVQRIPRYELLLREILKHTPDRARDRKATQTAFDEIRSIASHINEQKREVESLSKLIKIQNGIRGLKFALFEPHRHLCKEGALLVQKNREKPKERIVFLFNDILLWTNLKNDYKGHVKVEELKYVSEAGADTNASAGDGSDDLEFVVTGGKIMLTIKCSVAKQKHEWVAELRAQSEKWRKTIADQAPRIELKERQDELKQREEQAQQEKRKMLMQIGGRGFREPSQPGAGGEQYSNFGRDVLIGLLMERDREISALKRQLREAGLVITRDGADLQGSLKASGRDAKSSTRSAKTQTNKTVASTSNATRPAVPKLKLAFGAKPPSRPPPARPHFGSARATTRKGKSVSVTGARARPPQSARIRVLHRNAQTPRAPGSARKSRPHRSPSPARKPTRGHRSDRKAAAARLRKKTEKALAALKVGSRANFDGHVGTVRFMGLVHFGARVWCGLELDRRVGDHNGVFKGKRYFKCKAGHGVLVLADKVSSVAKTMRVTPLQAKAPRTKSSRATKASNKPRSSLKL